MNEIIKKVSKNIEESIRVKSKVLSDTNQTSISSLVEILIDCYKGGNKAYFAGNGGSFSDAQHLSAELSGRFYVDREPLECVLLASNFSYLTAVSNDYSYDDIFSRDLKSSGKKGDVLICFTTSGNSINVIKALQEARNIGIVTFTFTGGSGGVAKDFSDYSIIVPSFDTARIQECHMLIGHSVLELIEKELYK
jgi:D-sedoheptulose 7-phosphate isomerase